jgi:hypothetical protein
MTEACSATPTGRGLNGILTKACYARGDGHRRLVRPRRAHTGPAPVRRGGRGVHGGAVCRPAARARRASRKVMAKPQGTCPLDGTSLTGGCQAPTPDQSYSMQSR